MLAACYGHMGLLADGKAAIQEFNEKWKNKGYGTYRVEYVYDDWSYKDKFALDRISEGLRKAGMD